MTRRPSRNPYGRPRGTGGKPTKHAESEKVRAANAISAKSFRPGRREDTPEEKVRAYERDALGRRLTLETVEQVSGYLEANRVITKRLRDALASRDSDPKDIAALASARLSALDLVSILREVQNRWGQPVRSVLEVEGADRPPVIVQGPFEGWEAREAEHAAAVAGNGHDRSDTQH